MTTCRPASAAIGAPWRGRRKRLDDLLGLTHPPGPGLAAGLISAVGTDDANAVGFERCEVAPGGRGVPHGLVHGGRDVYRGPRGQDQRAEQVVGEARSHAGQAIGGGRRDQHQICPACELDVAHVGLGGRIPERVANGSARDRLQRGCRHEPVGAGRHHDLHVRAGLAEKSHEAGCLVRRDAARDPE